MSFTITPIGVNHAFTVSGLETNFLLSDGDEIVLLDCGTTAARALARQGLELADIGQVYISHLHLDHAGGLVQLGIQRYFRGLERPIIYLQQDLVQPLWQNFLRGPLQYITDRDGRPREGCVELFYDLRPISGDLDEQFQIGSFNLRAFPVQHIPGMPCHGLVVEDRVVLTTDTIFIPDLIESLANRFAPEAIFHDCSFADLQQVHATYDQLMTLPEDLKQLLYLVHYEDFVTESPFENEELLAIAGEAYSYE